MTRVSANTPAQAVIGMGVIAQEGNTNTVFSMAVETGIGSGTPGAYTEQAIVPSNLTGWTTFQTVAPIDGKLRYMRAKHTRIGATDSDWTASATILPGTHQELRDVHTYPEVLSVVGGVDGVGDVTAVVSARLAGAIRLATSKIGFPTRATVQGATIHALDAEGNYASGVLDTIGQGETLYIATLAYDNADASGAESFLLGTARVPRPTVQGGSSGEVDGWSSSQDAGSPETGTTIEDENDDAYTNLENANGVATTYHLYYDLTTNTLAVDDFARLKFYHNHGGGWTLFATRVYDKGHGTLTDEVVSLAGIMAAGEDFKVVLDYFGLTNPTDGCVFTFHGQGDSTPGVQYEKITSGALPVSQGGTEKSSHTDKAILLGAGVGALGELAVGASARGIISDGTDWGVSASAVALEGRANTFTQVQAFNPSSGPPFTTTRSTKVDNLNADFLDGYTAGDFSTPGHAHDFSDLTGTATKGQLPAAVAYEDEANTFDSLQTMQAGLTVSGGLTSVQALTAAGEVNITSGSDLVFDTLGRFYNGEAPEDQELLVWDDANSRWSPAAVQFIYNAGDAKVGLLPDGTSVAYVYDDPGSGADSPAGAPPQPGSGKVVATTHHKAISLEIRDYSKPADFRYFQWQKSLNGSSWTALANSSSTKVVHGRLTDGQNYYYKVRAVDRAGNSSSYRNATPYPVVAVADSSTAVFGIILASEIAVDSLAAIQADIGVITAGFIRDASSNYALRLSAGHSLSGYTRYLDFTATSSAPWIKAEQFELRADGDAIFGGVARDSASKFVVDFPNRLLTITDEQGTPRTRIKLGELDTGAADWGMQVFDTGGVEFFRVGHAVDEVLIELAKIGALAGTTGWVTIGPGDERIIVYGGSGFRQGELKFTGTTLATATVDIGASSSVQQYLRIKRGWIGKYDGTNENELATVIVSTSAPSGTAADGTFWARVP